MHSPGVLIFLNFRGIYFQTFTASEVKLIGFIVALVYSSGGQTAALYECAPSGSLQHIRKKQKVFVFNNRTVCISHCMRAHRPNLGAAALSERFAHHCCKGLRSGVTERVAGGVVFPLAS